MFFKKYNKFIRFFIVLFQCEIELIFGKVFIIKGNIFIIFGSIYVCMLWNEKKIQLYVININIYEDLFEFKDINNSLQFYVRF